MDALYLRDIKKNTNIAKYGLGLYILNTFFGMFGFDIDQVMFGGFPVIKTGLGFGLVLWTVLGLHWKKIGY